MTDPTAIQETKTPDGVTITSLDELRAYVHEQLGFSIGSRDPVIILHVMHQVFLADYERMLARHNDAITTVIGTAIKGLTKEALAENLQDQVRLADRTHLEFENQFKRARLLSAINFGVVSVSLLVFAYLILK